jgi:hypothetical protein
MQATLVPVFFFFGIVLLFIMHVFLPVCVCVCVCVQPLFCARRGLCVALKRGRCKLRVHGVNRDRHT